MQFSQANHTVLIFFNGPSWPNVSELGQSATKMTGMEGHRKREPCVVSSRGARALNKIWGERRLRFLNSSLVVLWQAIKY